MKKLFVMDAKNYDTALPEIYRVAVRGIVFTEGKLLLVRSSFGEVKFPGGGQENGENDFDTLTREIAEETGYHIRTDSIREFGEIEEKRLSTKEPMIWHQINRYYFCDIEGNPAECQYTENEKKYGLHQVWCSLDDAVRINQEMLCQEGIHAWNQREFTVLNLLQAYMQERSL